MKFIKQNLISIIGTLFMALGTSVFLVPNKLSSGGFAGIATIIYYLFDINMGSSILFFNIPLFIFAYFKLGKSFFIKSAISTIVFSIFLDLFNNINFYIGDKLLGSIYGGILVGIGSALILKAQSSTGGTDLIVQLVNEYNSYFKMGIMLVIIDIVIVLLNIIFLGEIEIGLYSFISIYIVGKMIDLFFEGINFSKVIYIITDKSYEISDLINNEFKKGTTGLYGKGMYTKKDKLLIMCVTKRNEVMKIIQLVRKIDKNSFIIISDVREVYGLGFK